MIPFSNGLLCYHKVFVSLLASLFQPNCQKAIFQPFHQALKMHSPLFQRNFLLPKCYYPSWLASKMGEHKSKTSDDSSRALLATQFLRDLGFEHTYHFPLRFMDQPHTSPKGISRERLIKSFVLSIVQHACSPRQRTPSLSNTERECFKPDFPFYAAAETTLLLS